MTAMFDTLKFARALRDGGQFTPEQSERLSDALSDAIAGEVVSRADLGATESKLGRKIDYLQSKLNRRIDDLRGELAAVEAKLDRKIDDLRDDLDRNAKDLRADLRNEIIGMGAKFEAAKADTLKWIVGIIGFQSAAIIGAAIVLARILGH